MNDFIAQIMPALQALAAAAITGLFAVLTKLIHEKVKNATLQSAALQVEDAVATAVKEKMQEALKLKEAAEDKKLSVEQALSLQKSAVVSAVTNMGPKKFKSATKALGHSAAGMERLLGAKVEAALHDLKAAARPFAK